MCKEKSHSYLRYMRFISGAFLLVFLAMSISYSQNTRIELGNTEVALNETFTITITVENDRIKNYDEFPDIQGFTKLGKSTKSSTNIINGRVSSSNQIVQNYQPNAEGTYTLSAFEMSINGQQFSSQGAKIKVLPPRKGAQTDPFAYDPFEEFFGGSDEPQEYIDVKADVFFALTTDKNEVYVGEGFTATLAFYEAETNEAKLQFHDLNRQINDILKKIKPANCWEENFLIENVTSVPVTINGKRYKQYNLYQASLYPLNNENIEFPEITLEMIKYKIAKNPDIFGPRRRGELIELKSDKKVVRVRELPPHPLKDKVAVGDYHLKESISSRNLETGQSFHHQFSIVGEGNISAIPNPEVTGKDDFEFYPPNVNQDISKTSNKVRGSKTFIYYGIPQEPGTYNLGDYIQWTYFNPKKHRYETLKSRLVVDVSGVSKKNQAISSADMGIFYEVIDSKDNVLTSRVHNGNVKLFANIIIFLMLALTLFILIRK